MRFTSPVSVDLRFGYCLSEGYENGDQCHSMGQWGSGRTLALLPVSCHELIAGLLVVNHCFTYLLLLMTNELLLQRDVQTFNQPQQKHFRHRDTFSDCQCRLGTLLRCHDVRVTGDKVLSTDEAVLLVLHRDARSGTI